VRRRILIVLLVPLLALLGCAEEAEQAEPPDTVVRPTTTVDDGADDGAATDDATDDAADDDAPDDDATEPTGAAGFAGVLRDAPERAAEASTGKVDLDMTMTAPEIGEISFSGTGSFDEGAGQMHMEIDMGELLRQLAEETGEPVPPGLDEPMEVIVDGDTIYMRIPAFEQQIGAAWVTAAIDDPAADQLGGATNDPSAMLDTLRGVSDDVEEVGSEDVRGVETTHYSATIDIEQALEELPPDERDRLEGQLDALGGGDLPVDVWIDDDGLVRRMEMTLDELVAADGMEGAATISMEFYDYGEPVDIEIPDPAETRPADELGFDLGG
jgi:hypothetical protein